ncbi:hypothetical protein [Viridibacterium curvum]|uniref:Uncharacterized protein n=1 Tax=Viridibacterium curvum TaxID=1101404 RepID=A0ABP9R605_9RHOO
MERIPEHWNHRLPLTLQDLVIAPVTTESFHDDSVPASKWRGYDAAGELCYYHHTYTLWQEQFDEEDQPWLRQLEAESLEAWRCHDGNWLRRLIRGSTGGHCGGREDRGFELVSAREIPRL